MLDYTQHNKEGGYLTIDEKDVIFYDGFVRIISGMENGTEIYKSRTLCGEYDNPVTLKDIENEWVANGARTILVIFEDATRGGIYRFGNYGKTWQKIGTTIGYA